MGRRETATPPARSKAPAAKSAGARSAHRTTSSGARFQLILATAGATLLTLLAGTLMYRQSRAQFHDSVAQDLTAFSQLYRSELRQRIDSLSMALEMLLMDRDTARLFAERDREGLAAHLTALYREKLQPDHGIDQLHFHVPPAQSFLRVHRPDQFGDDMSSFREILVRANTDAVGVAGIEVTRSGPGIKVVRPVFHEGRFVGTVELATAITTVLNRLSQTMGIEYGVGLDSEVWNRAQCSDLLAAEAVSGNVVYYEISGSGVRSALRTSGAGTGVRFLDADGAGLVASSFPLLDFRGRQVGKVVAVKDVTGWIAEFRASLLWTGGWLVLLALGAIAITYFLIERRFTAPLRSGIRQVVRVASGDYAGQAEVAGWKEVADLLASVNALTTQLSGLAAAAESLADGDLAPRLDEARAHGRLGAALTGVQRRVSESVSGSNSRLPVLGDCSAKLSTTAAGLLRSASQQGEVLAEAGAMLTALHSEFRRRASQARTLQGIAERGGAHADECDSAIVKATHSLQEVGRLAAEVEEQILEMESPSGLGSAATPRARELAARARDAAREARQRAFEGIGAARRARVLASQVGPELQRISELVRESAGGAGASGVDEVGQVMTRVRHFGEEHALSARQVAAVSREIQGIALSLRESLGVFRSPTGLASQRPASALPMP